MIIKSKAPLRLGLAGGGTDISDYCVKYGGRVINATINLYAYATIFPLNNGEIKIRSYDLKKECIYKSSKNLDYDSKLDLIKAVYNRIMEEYPHNNLSFNLSTYVDAPPGSGLGSSSTLVVAVLGALVEWLNLPLSEYEIAKLAYEIERKDMGISGGMQDQYAATFGGINYMEFFDEDKVIVNPLRIKKEYLYELESNLILFYTQQSRYSSDIIDEQKKSFKDKKSDSLDAMHSLKDQAYKMKNALIKGEINKVGNILNEGWKTKKLTSKKITNKKINNIYYEALKAGASGGKISGAGGGGFMILFCPNNSKYKIIEKLKDYEGDFYKYNFIQEGLITWKVSN